MQTRKVILRRQHSKVRDIYPNWEENKYMMYGGCVFMNLSMSHLIQMMKMNPISLSQKHPFEQPCCRYLKTKNVVVVTHIPFQSHVHNQRILMPFDRV